MALKFFSDDKQVPTVEDLAKKKENDKAPVVVVEKKEKKPRPILVFSEKQERLLDLIKEGRKSLSLREMAAKCQITRQTIVALLGKRATPSRITTIRLCKYFEKDWKDYYEEQKRPRNNKRRKND